MDIEIDCPFCDAPRFASGEQMRAKVLVRCSSCGETMDLNFLRSGLLDLWKAGIPLEVPEE